MSEAIENKNMDLSLLPTLSKAVPSGFWKLLYKDLGQPGMQVIGTTLAKAIDFCCLPIFALGCASDAIKANLGHKLNQFTKKIEEVPKDKLCQVDPQIGAPILDHLSHTTNEEIADLFTTLLANASNLDTFGKAHPAFVHIISRLSVDEARIIKYLKDQEDILFCTFRAIIKEGAESTFITIEDHATLLPFKINFAFPENVRAYLSNLSSLGLLKDNTGLYKTDETEYNEICEKYNLERYRENYKAPEYKKVDFEKGFFEVTPFGRQFIDACIRN